MVLYCQSGLSVGFLFSFFAILIQIRGKKGKNVGIEVLYFLEGECRGYSETEEEVICHHPRQMNDASVNMSSGR